VSPEHRGPPYDVVFFDCDSTLSAIEGIDELARAAGCYDELAALTRRAMSGEIALEDVYGQRLTRIAPSRAAIDALAELYVERLVPGAAHVIGELHARGKRVHVVSGGLLPAVSVVAAHLGVRGDRVHAVPIGFTEDGCYVGFDRDAPLAKGGGKARVCAEMLLAGERAVLVGDGVTDAEVLQAGVDFIGFGGVVERPNVRRYTPHYLSTADLSAVLPLLLSEDER